MSMTSDDSDVIKRQNKNNTLVKRRQNKRRQYNNLIPIIINLYVTHS